MNEIPLVSGPYAHKVTSISRTMGWVMLALLPSTAFGLYQFGWPALFLWLVTIATALLVETICLRIAGKPVYLYLMDGSALLTAWLLAMTLPPWAPWWIGVVGAALAIIVGKQVFGGIGQNLFNPAMVARVALLISFPLEMTTWISPKPLLSSQAPDFMEALSISFGKGLDMDAVSSASILGHVKTELGQHLSLADALNGTADIASLAMGSVAGSLGETSALLILAGGLLLLIKGVIRWHIPVAMIGTLALLSTLLHWVDVDRYPGALFHLLSGATFLGAFFIATDPVTSPVTVRGQLVFGAGCGMLVFVIRTWAGYPEGMAFAVLLMNALTPVIDHYLKPRIYGRTRRGEPLTYHARSESGDD